jgi:anti-sigma factor RsiW
VYLLGAIEPAQRALVNRHLAACPDCRAELAGLAGLPALLRSAPVAEALQLSGDDAAAVVPGPSLAALAGRVSRIRRRRWRRTVAAALIAGFAAAWPRSGDARPGRGRLGWGLCGRAAAAGRRRG